MTYSTMAEYYSDKQFLPTHGRFTTPEDLEKHTAFRRSFLNDKLYLPERLFYRASLLEIGPDGGENALAFAKFGAALTLVEPNPAAQKVLLEYFRRYNLASHLTGLYSEDLAAFAKRPMQSLFDFIVAEGFIYSIQPSEIWINLFARLLKPGGMVLISYYEKFGGFIELFTKQIYNRVKDLTGKPGLEVAHALFDVKWSLIPHTRSFEQWYSDVILNPFVASEFFLEAEELCQQAEASGLRLYSSWPVYRNALDCYWHKLEEKPGHRKVWIEQQREAWMYGEPLRILSPIPKCLVTLESLLQADDADAIIKFCQSDSTWLRLYGIPNHFAVFEKL